MAKANSDNTGTNGALDKFFSVFNPSSGASTYKNIDILMNDVFCADDPRRGFPGLASRGTAPNSVAPQTLRHCSSNSSPRFRIFGGPN